VQGAGRGATWSRPPGFQNVYRAGASWIQAASARTNIGCVRHLIFSLPDNSCTVYRANCSLCYDPEGKGREGRLSKALPDNQGPRGKRLEPSQSLLQEQLELRPKLLNLPLRW
jgi:hypothetical protein